MILQPLYLSINVSTIYILVTKGIQLQAKRKSEAEGEGGSERGEREETEKNLQDAVHAHSLLMLMNKG